MNRWLKKWFAYSRTERNGVTVLILLLLLILSGNMAIKWWLKPAQDMDMDVFKEKIQQWQSLQQAETIPDTLRVKQPTLRLHPFNPNRISQAAWERMGLPAHTGRTLINYREAGGTFRQPEDLQKLYTLSDSLYQKLRPYIRIPRRADTVAAYPTNPIEDDRIEKKWTGPVALNQSDSATLRSVHGIGPYFAAQIPAYRSKLGGYTHKTQLLEIFRFDSAHLARVDTALTLDPTLIRKININAATVEELGKHPYISWSVARHIVRYREQHGPFEHVDALLQIHTIDKAWVQKVAPYLATK